MKLLVVSGSRSDRNGLAYLARKLREAQHDAALVETMPNVKPADAPAALWHVSTLLDKAGWPSGWLRRPLGGFPDFAVVGGDRYETLASALACSIAGVPLAHIAGGDATEGSADERYRWAITALAQVHCATNETSFNRLANVLRTTTNHLELTGSPAVDYIQSMQTQTTTRAAVCEHVGIKSEALAVVCMHPYTGDAAHNMNPLWEVNAVTAALDRLRYRFGLVWLGANDDVGGGLINKRAQEFCASFPNAAFVDNLPAELYFSLLVNASVMIGNSSAGFYEAPEFGLPVVNVGDRQLGRTVPKNILLTSVDADAIKRNIEHAIMHIGYVECENPYGDGKACERIIKALEANAWRSSRETVA